jgi:hypothetical protein
MPKQKNNPSRRNTDIIAFNARIPFQSASAFHFRSDLHKLLDELFHKSPQRQTVLPSSTPLQNPNNTSITASLPSLQS